MVRTIYVADKVLTGTMKYQGVTVLTYEIHYPQFAAHAPSVALTRLNTRYRRAAQALAHEAQTTLYRQAVEDYQNRAAQGGDDPFPTYEVRQIYTVTYLQNCVLSLYTDQYRFTGGAHGITVRQADTYDTRTAQEIPLSALFPRGTDFLSPLMAQVMAQIQPQQEYFFVMSEAEVRQAFDPKNFYLTPDDLVLYFQQYDIAPYVTGIPTFAIPYAAVGASVPGCKA